jgi:peptidoglycan hydrolase-like amidase
MSGECPIDFLKAQCVVARSWTLANTERKHADLGIDYCNDDCCQRYQGLDGVTEAARRAVAETAGEVLIAPGGELRVVDANYSKSCGGIAEDPRYVWPDIPKPGLSPLVDAPASSPIRAMYPLGESKVREFLTGGWLERCDAYCSDRAVPPDAIGRYLGRVDTPEGFFRWKVTLRREQLETLLERKLFQRLEVPEAERPSRLDRVRVTRRGVSGRATEVVLDYMDRDGRARSFTLSDQYWIRHALHESFLYSSAFLVEETRAGGVLEEVTLVGAGWGHGAGFCQIGGLGMALQNIGYRNILAHYFPTSTLCKVYAR